MFTSKRSYIRQKSPLNVGGILCLTAAIYVTYYLLVQDILPVSIASVLTHSDHLPRKWHLLTIGLIPIYLGLVIFGTSVLCLQGGAALQRWVVKNKNK